MNNYPLQHDKSRGVPSKKLALAASGLLLAVACQSSSEQSLPAAPYCTFTADTPSAKTISPIYADGIKQVLHSLDHAQKDHVVSRHATTRAGLHVSSFKLDIPGTPEGWTFTNEQTTSYKNPNDLEAAWYAARPNGYACAYVEKKAQSYHTISSPHIIHNAKNAQAIGNATLSSLLRNAGAMQHETPGFLDNQLLPAVSSDFWPAMEVADPPLVPVQPAR